MFDSKKPYDLGVRPRFRPYDVFTLRKPYESGFSRTSGNAGLAGTTYDAPLHSPENYSVFLRSNINFSYVIFWRHGFSIFNKNESITFGTTLLQTKKFVKASRQTFCALTHSFLNFPRISLKFPTFFSNFPYIFLEY